MSDSVIIVGAGHAGTTLAFRLRALGFDGSVELIGEEPEPPYQRPLLSKKYLLGEADDTDLHLKNPEQYREQNIHLRQPCTVVEINADRRTIRLSDGSSLSYRYLVLATGCRPRLPDDGQVPQVGTVHVLRTVRHAQALRASWRQGQHLLIVGGGYVGLETAAVARALGVRVTLIERSERILNRVTCAATADVVRDLHRRNGVRILEGTGLDNLKTQAHANPHASDNGAMAVRAMLSTGETLDIDQVLFGIGAVPEVSLAKTAGLTLDNGVVIDAQMRSSNPDILAIGDCANLEWQGERLRLESVPNAIEMANVAAHTIMDDPKPYRGVPWFWSDQYDIKLQLAGINTGYTSIVRRCTDGNDATSTSSVWYFRDTRLIALDAFNDAKAFMLGRRWIESGLSPSPQELSRADLNLQSLALHPTPLQPAHHVVAST